MYSNIILFFSPIVAILILIYQFSPFFFDWLFYQNKFKDCYEYEKRRFFIHLIYILLIIFISIDGIQSDSNIKINTSIVICGLLIIFLTMFTKTKFQLFFPNKVKLNFVHLNNELQKIDNDGKINNQNFILKEIDNKVEANLEDLKTNFKQSIKKDKNKLITEKLFEFYKSIIVNNFNLSNEKLAEVINEFIIFKLKGKVLFDFQNKPLLKLILFLGSENLINYKKNTRDFLENLEINTNSYKPLTYKYYTKYKGVISLEPQGKYPKFKNEYLKVDRLIEEIKLINTAK